MALQHGHRHASWPWTYSVNIYMTYVWIWKCSMDRGVKETILVGRIKGIICLFWFVSACSALFRFVSEYVWSTEKCFVSRRKSKPIEFISVRSEKNHMFEDTLFATTLNDRQSSFSLDDTQHWQQLLSYVLFPVYNSSGVSCFTVKEWRVVSPLHRPHILAHFLLSLKCGKCDTTVYSN